MRPTKASVRVDKVGWTLHKRRKARTDKTAKRSDRNADLLTRLLIITRLPTSERLREALTAHIRFLVTSLWYYEWTPDWLDIKAAHWIVATVWAQLPLEKNTKVHTNLLRLAAKFIYQRPFSYSKRGRERNSIGGAVAACSVLEQEPTAVQRRHAIQLLFSSVWNARMDMDGHHRIVRACLLIVHHYATSPISGADIDTVDHLMICLMHGVHSGSARDSSMPIDAIMDNEYALPFIFEGLRSTEEDLHNSFCRVLDTILSNTQPASRVTLIVRHWKHLQEAFVVFLNWPDRCHYHSYLEFMRLQEFSAIIATTPSILDLLTSGMRWYRKGECHWNETFCKIIVAVLGSVLDHGRMLQEILGYGVLVVATHFSQDPFDVYAHYRPRQTEIFRTILERHPEWRRRFREFTEDAVAGSLTARIGRSFPLKDRNGVDYVLEQEDSQI